MLLWFVLAAIGLTNIFVVSTIMDPVRESIRKRLPDRLKDGVDCHQCMGFWCGVACGGLLLFGNATESLLASWVYANVLDFLAAAAVWLMCWISKLLLFGFASSFVASFVSTLFDIVILHKDKMNTLEWPEETDGSNPPTPTTPNGS
jgi:hypothetical protein